MMRSTLMSFAVAVVASGSMIATTGCAKKDNVVAKTPTTISQAEVTGPGAAPNVTPNGGAGIDTNGLHVSNEIARLCGLPQTASKTSFEFDSATINDDDRVVLSALAKCMSDGALRGRKVALTGRADARGEEEYNMALGGSRADAVRRYLHDLGVGQERLATTSRGELDATGTDESGWANDRRVDIAAVN
jgi:peptidoglycan-associated lipoprotein